MALVLYQLYRRHVSDSFRGGFFFFFIPTTLALLSSLLILLYIYSTSTLFTNPIQTHLHLKSSPNLRLTQSSTSIPVNNFNETIQFGSKDPSSSGQSHISDEFQKRVNFYGSGENMNTDIYHVRDIFLEDYKEMNRSLKIYIYPHRKNDPFANVLLPVSFVPTGNYASESYFKKVLSKSHFITKKPSEAHLFFLPFSIARLRHDPRIGVGGIQDFVRDYVFNISHAYPYWNRSGGADHFYVACHSIGRSAMEKADEVKFNAIQVVCSSSYFLSGYVAHKDASLPQIWPRDDDPPNLASCKRKRLAFFAGSINSPVRQKLLQVWQNDSEIFTHFGRLATPYANSLLGSKFCLHVKGFEVNTARIADSLHYGCVPVIIANHYDLPFTDILNWEGFSVIVATLDIPLLKKILKEISEDEYLMLKRNVLYARKHFQWHVSPVDYDAFYTVMYELWLRRSSVKIHI